MNLKCGLVEESYKYRSGVEELSDEKEKMKCSFISLVSGRRDWAAFQILLKGDDEFTVSIGESPCFSPKGALTNVRLNVKVDGLKEAEIKLNAVGLVEDDDRLLKSDMLLNDEAVYVEKKSVQPIWVEILVPEEARPGRYNGEVKIYTHSMFEDEKEIDTLTFQIEVKDVVLPKPADYRFHLDLWQHLSNIARKHETPLWSNEHFRVVEEYVKSLGELGQKAVTVIVSEIPWSGQSCFRTRNYLSDLFEYSMIKVEKNEEGRYIYDYSAMERYIELCFKYGIDKEIEVFGLINIWVIPEEGYGKVAEDFPDAIRIRYFDRSDNCYKYIKSGEEIKDYIKALERYFINKNWIDKVRVVADEPRDIELFRKRLNVFTEMGLSFKFKAAILHADFINEFKDRIQDFVPILTGVCEEWDLLKNIRENVPCRLLWYTCCEPKIPNTFISSPLLESRFIGILTAYMKFDGFLRWNYTVWPEKPREMICYRYPGWKAGDTNFVYPANDGRPILTLRYKNLKRGIEDFELICMLRQKHLEPEKVLERIWEKVLRCRDIKEFHHNKGRKPTELYSLEHTDYMEMKALLLEELSNLKS